MQRTAFDLFHPGVALCYFAAMLALGMAAMQPVCLGLTLLGALAYAIMLRGWRAAARSALWQAPLVLVLAVANPLFSASGSTELFRIGLHAIYAESLVYGLCMGVMLISVLLLISNATLVITSDKIMELTGNVIPVVGLMLSMTARLVPQFVRRGFDIASVQRACTAARGAEGAHSRSRAALARRLRQVSVLMGWSMEDSLDTASAMKARGWGAGARRSVYARHRFKRADAAALAFVAALAALAAVSAFVACTAFSFYPTLRGFSPWGIYVPFALFALLPTALEIGERARWRS